MMKCYIFFLFCFSLTDFGKCDEPDFCKSDYICFQRGIKFGTSTFSYQIEGGFESDCKGENVWDEYPEKFAKGPNGDTAGNSYNNFDRDLSLLKFLGVDFYKFSISWSRVLPTGFAKTINKIGLSYYEEIIDGLLANNIEPHILMHDHDLPQHLEDLGGWTNPKIVDWFTKYANVLFERFAGKVKYWYTINDPKKCFEAYGGYIMAPHHESPLYAVAAVKCAKNMMLAHGRVYELYGRMYRKTDSYVGYAVSLANTDSFLAELGLGNKCLVSKAVDALTFMFTDPVYSTKRGWSEELVRTLAEEGTKLPEFTAKEAKMLKNASDILVLKFKQSMEPKRANFERPSFYTEQGERINSWKEIFTVDSLEVYESMGQLQQSYSHLPMKIVVELGAATEHGINDEATRAKWIKEYLKAVTFGTLNYKVNTVGITIDSLLDGVYHTKHYTERYGLFETDFFDPDFKTFPRTSALFYQSLIQSMRVQEPFLYDEFNNNVCNNDFQQFTVEPKIHKADAPKKNEEMSKNNKVKPKKNTETENPVDQNQCPKDLPEPKYTITFADLHEHVKPNQRITVTIVENSRKAFRLKVRK